MDMICMIIDILWHLSQPDRFQQTPLLLTYTTNNKVSKEKSICDLLGYS